MQLGVEHILRGCGRRTSCMQASRHDCRHDTTGQRLLPGHVSHYISPSRETLSEPTDSGDAAAGLSTITPTAQDRGPVFETVPELRDRLAVMLVTATKHYSPAGRRSTTHFVVGTLR